MPVFSPSTPPVCGCESLVSGTQSTLKVSCLNSGVDADILGLVSCSIALLLLFISAFLFLLLLLIDLFSASVNISESSLLISFLLLILLFIACFLMLFHVSLQFWAETQRDLSLTPLTQHEKTSVCSCDSVKRHHYSLRHKRRNRHHDTMNLSSVHCFTTDRLETDEQMVVCKGLHRAWPSCLMKGWTVRAYWSRNSDPRWLSMLNTVKPGARFGILISFSTLRGWLLFTVWFKTKTLWIQGKLWFDQIERNNQILSSSWHKTNNLSCR